MTDARPAGDALRIWYFAHLAVALPVIVGALRSGKARREGVEP